MVSPSTNKDFYIPTNVVFFAECNPMSQSLDELGFPTSFDYIVLSKKELEEEIEICNINDYFVYYIHNAVFTSDDVFVNVKYSDINRILNPKNYLIKIEDAVDDVTMAENNFNPKYSEKIENTPLNCYINNIMLLIEFNYSGLKVLDIGFANMHRGGDDSITKWTIPYYKISRYASEHDFKEKTPKYDELVKNRIKEIIEF